MSISKENAKKGETLFISSGCIQCHSVSGEARYGPSLNFILDKEIIVIREGRKLSVKLDREFIIRSMKSPEYEKLTGYENKKMSTINLSPGDIEYIADYLIYINTNKENN